MKKKPKQFFSLFIIVLFLCSSLNLPVAAAEDSRLETSNVSDVLVEEGYYQINSALNSNLMVDIYAGATNDGANIQVYSNNNTNAQKYYISSAGNGWYVIRAASNTNMVLDVTGGSRNSSANVQLYTYNGSDAQLWRFELAGQGYHIQSKLGCYLDVSGGGTSNGTNVQVYSKNNSNAQKWMLSKTNVSIEEGYWQISTTLASNMLIDVAGGDYSNQANIQIYSQNGSNAQKVSIVSTGNGWYVIQNAANPNMVLDVEGGSRNSGANVQLYTYNGSDAQLWRFESAGQGCYYIQNKLGCYLDVSGGGTANCTNVQVYTKNNSNAQKWMLSKTNVSVEEGYYQICTALKSNMLLDVAGGNYSNHSNIQIYAQNETNAQKYYISSAGNGWYVIGAAENTNLVLDVEGGSRNSSANVQLYEYNGSDAQLWEFESAGQGYYYIQNKLGCCLDVSGGGTVNQTNIHVYAKNNSNAQKWKILKIPDSQISKPVSVYTSSANEFRFPLKGAITRSSSTKTNGIYCDYKAALGTPVYAPCDGTVTIKQSYATNYGKLASYGNNLDFTSSDGKYNVKMAHLQSFNGITVRYTSSLGYPCGSSKYSCSTITLASKNVKQGDLLGYTGMTGNASGPHLHLEVKKNGTPVDPASTFKSW